MENSHRWRELDGVVYFTVATNPKTGKEWVKYFETKGVELTPTARDLLLKAKFVPTTGKEIEVAVVKGCLFSEKVHIGSVFEHAYRHGFVASNEETICLIRDNFTDEEIKEMNLRWIATGSHDILTLLINVMKQKVEACANSWWGNSGGFTFLVRKVSVQ